MRCGCNRIQTSGETPAVDHERSTHDSCSRAVAGRASRSEAVGLFDKGRRRKLAARKEPAYRATRSSGERRVRYPPLLSVREQWGGGRPIARKVQYQEYSKAKTLGRPRNCVAADRGGNATASKSNRQDDVAIIPQIRFSVRLSASRSNTPSRTADHRTQVSIPRPSEPTKHSNIRNIQVEHARQYSQVNGIPARVSSNRRVPVAGGEGV